MEQTDEKVRSRSKQIRQSFDSPSEQSCHSPSTIGENLLSSWRAKSKAVSTRNMVDLPRRNVVMDPDNQATIVDEAYRTIGSLLNNMTEPALLVDALCMDGPIVGATAGVLELTGYRRDQLLGENCRLMLRGVPEIDISKSARTNLRDYYGMCQIAGLNDIGEINSLQPNMRVDGSVFVNLSIFGLCMVQGHPYILSVQIPMGEGLCVRMRQAETNEAVEKARTIFKRIREILRTKGQASIMETKYEPPMASFLEQPVPARPEFAFFCERLQDHCLLMNEGFTAIRREPYELATNCLVFGNSPVQRTAEGLGFSVRVDMVTSSFVGLPVLGFTRRKPKDEPKLYPSVSRCLGQSVLIGACGDAFARDKYEHFEIGFKPPSQAEVQTWSLQPDLPSQKRDPPCKLSPGDILHCSYTWDGRIQLTHNDTKVMDFDVGRPVDGSADYYAVVDVCFSAYSLTLLQSTEPSTTAGETEELDADECFLREVSFASEESFVSTTPTKQDVNNATQDESPRRMTSQISSQAGVAIMDTLVKEAVVKRGIRAAVAECNFCVTVADPKGKDCPLIAVSEEFERMTGFLRHEALGVNCRFLNQGCECNPMDLLNLRVASETGAPFTAVLPNRKKSGEMFLNLLDLRGLTVAKDCSTGEDIWFLIGIQADVTDLTDEEVPEAHIAQMQMVVDSVRALVSRELSEFAVQGANEMDLVLGPVVEQTNRDSCILLNKPEWRPGAPLGERQPGDAPVYQVLGDYVSEAAAWKSETAAWKSESPKKGVCGTSPGTLAAQQDEKESSSSAAGTERTERGPSNKVPLSLTFAVLFGAILLVAYRSNRRPI